MKEIGICGHFGGRRNFLDGQTVKTKIITKELVRLYGRDEIQILDTYKFVKQCGFKVVDIVRLIHSCENILMFPAYKGLRVFGPLLIELNKIYNRKLHYIVIGGWLPEFIQDKPYLEKCLKAFDYIYVETQTMRRALEDRGFTNVVVMPNCKDLKILKKEELVYHSYEPYKLCTFSRVSKLKGIEEAVKIVRDINAEKGRTVYKLDIYGPIAETETEWFENLKKDFTDEICYKGEVSFEKSVNVVKDYFALLFPTLAYTEGIPGTIIDAYAAGVPVIASKWESYIDLIDEGVTGLGYTFDNQDELKRLLCTLATCPECVDKMKKNCLEKAKEFQAKSVVEKFWGGGTTFKIIKKFNGNVVLRLDSGIKSFDSLPLCTFSRVSKEKGIGDAVEVIKEINNQYGETLFTLDIYGQVDNDQEKWFENLKKEFPDYIRYRGLVPFDKSTETVSQYYALLFPTYYAGEGFAGTILDAFASGVPVIASDWHYNAEILEDKKTGLVYPTRNNEAFKECLMKAYNHRDRWNEMKEACLDKAKDYKPEHVIKMIEI